MRYYSREQDRTLSETLWKTLHLLYQQRSYKKLGITQEELDSVGDVEIE